MKIVYYDLETTDMRPVTGPHGVQIIQIGAVCKRTGLGFNNYLIPTVPISPGATQVHGLTRGILVQKWRNGDSDVFPNMAVGLKHFMDVLQFQKDYRSEEIGLVSY